MGTGMTPTRVNGRGLISILGTSFSLNNYVTCWWTISLIKLLILQLFLTKFVLQALHVIMVLFMTLPTALIDHKSILTIHRLVFILLLCNQAWYQLMRSKVATWLRLICKNKGLRL